MRGIVAVIPARGGSKGIPNKNIRDFCGKPLIAWAIETALRSTLIDRIIVSTDSDQIATVSRQYNAETPFLQPQELAQDRSPLEPVLKYTLEWLKTKEWYNTEAVLLLLATNPLRQPRHLDEAIKLFLDKGLDSVIATSELPAAHNPLWVFEISKDNSQRVVNAKGQPMKEFPAQRQQLPRFYTKNDIVFVLKPQNLYDTPPNLFGEKQELYIMSDFYDADINTPEEWGQMENKFLRLQKDEKLL